MKSRRTRSIGHAWLNMARSPGSQAHNPNCDGSHCNYATGETRKLPTGGDGNAILCYTCFNNEIRWRQERNVELAKENQFKLPAWSDLEVVNEGGEA